MTKLIDIIDKFYSGDWGELNATPNSSLPVKCVRGADFDNLSIEFLDEIPVRFINEKNNSILPENSIIIEKSGGSPTQSTGRIVFVSSNIKKKWENIVCSNFCTAFTVKKEWDPFFVYEYLQLIYYRGVFFNFESKTSGLKNLQLDEAFKKIPVPNISLPEQRRISKILWDIRDKQINNYSIINMLEKMETSIYEEWFLRFNFEYEENKKYKDNNGLFIYSDELKYNIPVNWDVKRISDVINTNLGGTPNTSEKNYWNGDIPWISSGELDSNIITDSIKKITAEGVENSSTYFADEGSVLISLVRYLRVSILGIPACFNQSVVSLSENDIFKKEYIYPFLKKMLPKFMALRTGNQQPHINKDIVDKAYILCPPKEILDKYYGITKKYYELHINLHKEIVLLNQIKKYILPILMNSQLQIED